ncbi:iron-containing alcohol dehydrogenase [Grimontia kaedaensis]|uniref:Iron-containing alcohol dehydrogenase n=1 Tax=Grimontia kaedaensis TaxID=2872157 RepID=A0ABY4WWP0_9GAMM|nr:iron-containing alcohol dehydrogenase [Grimontia kaedaensis]USH03493.1 iron-containing alcohol dehydrogenase [Grimontia kaedaensis]
MSTSVAMPRMMEFGEDATKRLPDIVKGFNASRVLILTDKTMVQMGYAAMVTELLSEAGIQSHIYADTIPEPTSQSIEEAVSVTRDSQTDCIVALGGGSAIDSAKAISMLASHGGIMRDYKAPRIVNETGIPVVAIPTTAGTGSEVTKFTIITDSETDEKMLCIGLGFLPVAALVDYKLTMSLPPRITADTGIDALTHAIEAYVSKKGNPFSDYNALEAMRLIAPNLRKAYHDGQNVDARQKMMMGSTLAGIAFSNASVALVHGMSRPIGAFFHVPHGLSNAMLLPSITAFSIPACPERYAQCSKAMGLVDESASVEEANSRLKQELLALNEELKVPSLEEFGVAKGDFDAVLDTMIQQAFGSGSPGNNPRVPSEDEMKTLYISLWK